MNERLGSARIAFLIAFDTAAALVSVATFFALSAADLRSGIAFFPIVAVFAGLFAYPYIRFVAARDRGVVPRAIFGGVKYATSVAVATSVVLTVLSGFARIFPPFDPITELVLLMIGASIILLPGALIFGTCHGLLTAWLLRRRRVGARIVP